MQGRVITFLHFADTLGLLIPLACGERHKGVKQTGNLERIWSLRQSRLATHLSLSSYLVYLQINQYYKRQSCQYVWRIPVKETRHLVSAPTLIKPRWTVGERLDDQSGGLNNSHN